MGRASRRRLVCPIRVWDEGVWYRQATESQAYVDAAGVRYKVNLILRTDRASIAAVDEAYRKKYSADPSLPLLLTEQARSTTSLLIPQA
jgi:hypothetical protein